MHQLENCTTNRNVQHGAETKATGRCAKCSEDKTSGLYLSDGQFSFPHLEVLQALLWVPEWGVRVRVRVRVRLLIQRYDFPPLQLRHRI